MEFSTSSGTDSGFAAGYSTKQTALGWQWSAYGPCGVSMGIAPSDLEAQERARTAMRHLSRSDPPLL